MELGLAGKRALVTAASRGLGYAVAEALLAEGCRVCISSSNQARIDAAARSLSRSGADVHARVADIGDSEACARFFEWTVAELGGIDILVNNTVGPPAGAVLSLDDAAWIRGFETIVMSALRLSRAAIPLMRRTGSGAIVNLASMSVKQPIDGIALSNTYRPALAGLAKTLSREAAPEVRVNTIATEHILTDRIRDIAGRLWRRDGESVDDAVERAAREAPLQRYGTPAELANAVVFLCSDAASYITGVTLSVDGGL